MAVIKKADRWLVRDHNGLHTFETEEEALAFEKDGSKPAEGRATWFGEAHGGEEEEEDGEEEAGSDE